MRLTTKNGWILTEYTSKVLQEEFDGDREELIEYALKYDVSSSMFSKGYREDGVVLMVKPRVCLGNYDLQPNEDGVVATDGL